MPWNETSPGTEQIRFIERWQAGGVTFAQMCRQFGVSRKTGYKRVQRFRSYGWEGLGDWSRAPRRHPNTTPGAVAERLIAARQSHPTWGPKKLVAWLRSVEAEVAWPAPSTAGDILGRAGLVRHRKRRRHAAPWSTPFAAADEPNDVWCIDFKGWFRTGDGARVDPLTLQDAARGTCWFARTCRGPAAHRYAGSLSVPSESTVCPGPSGRTTDRRLPASVWEVCRHWRYGGSSWVSYLSGSNPVTRSKTDDWSDCTGR